ncbi:MAG: ATP-binding protein [Candidatus Kapabacteria bacterium]|nr:ATP-binding protein [Candidatus Kapabacteria bacterium]
MRLLPLNINPTKIFKSIIFILILFISLSFILQAREIVLDDIRINSVSIPDDFRNSIALSKTDSITFLYHLQIQNEEQNPFLFKITIQNDSQLSTFTLNKNIISYKRLPSGNYNIKISAFEPQNSWQTNELTINFIVDDILAEKFQKSIQDYHNRLASSISGTKKDEKSPFHIMSNSVVMITLSGLLLILIVASVIIKNNRKGLKKNQKMNENITNKKINGVTKMADKNKNSVSTEEYNKLALENENLKEELRSLREQIDALSSRAEELNKQNRELKESLDKISKSKSELEELQKQKDDLFAIIIHDIKNPAALIKSLVELLRSYDLTATEQQEVMEDIFVTTKKIVTLSQEVTKVLALESNTLKLNKEPINIKYVIEDVVKRNMIAANNKSIAMKSEVPDNLPEIEIDAQKIEEVIENLISNAIKFSNEGGKVKVTAKANSRELTVEVADNGLGLSEEDVTKAFQRGARLSARPTAGEHSSGFGLWIVKKMVEAHNGKVWVKSALGRGSTFAFSIPYNQNQ